MNAAKSAARWWGSRTPAAAKRPATTSLIAAPEATRMAGGDGLGAYDRQRRPRTQMIARRSRQIGVAAQWASPAAVSLRNTVMRLLPSSSFARSIAPVLDWAT